MPSDTKEEYDNDNGDGKDVAMDDTASVDSESGSCNWEEEMQVLMIILLVLFCT